MKKVILLMMLSVSVSVSAVNAPSYVGSCGFSKSIEKIDIKNAINNKDFQSAMRIKHNNMVSVKSSIPGRTYKSVDTSSSIPLFLEAAKSNITYASYEGLQTILEGQLTAGATETARKFTRPLAARLSKAGCCIGYIYSARSFTREISPDGKANYAIAKDIIDSGVTACNRKSIDPIVTSIFEATRARINAFLYLSKKGELK